MQELKFFELKIIKIKEIIEIIQINDKNWRKIILNRSLIKAKTILWCNKLNRNLKFDEASTNI